MATMKSRDPETRKVTYQKIDPPSPKKAKLEGDDEPTSKKGKKG